MTVPIEKRILYKERRQPKVLSRIESCQQVGMFTSALAHIDEPGNVYGIGRPVSLRKSVPNLTEQMPFCNFYTERFVQLWP